MKSLDRDLAKKLIRAVGSEYEYQVSGNPQDAVFDVYFAREKHGIAFQIRHSTHLSTRWHGHKCTTMRESLGLGTCITFTENNG
jgi:hypothetical protein